MFEMRDDLSSSFLVDKRIKVDYDEKLDMIFVTIAAPGHTKSDINIESILLDNDNFVKIKSVDSITLYEVLFAFKAMSLLNRVNVSESYKVSYIYPDGYMINEGILVVFFKLARVSWNKLESKLDPRIDPYESYMDQATKDNK